MSDVFISYKAEDRRRILPLAQALQGDGYSVWWDEHIGTGDEWRQTIEKQLDAAKCVIVIWSKRSAGPDGQFVRDEAARAQQRHVYVPVTIDAVRIPLGFGESQATSLRSWKGGRSDPPYQTVLSAVRRIAGPGGESTGVALSDNRGIARRAVLAGGTVATVAIAAGGGWMLFGTSRASASTKSIAVLPFANLSGDPAQAYFSDGIAEELRSALARLAGLNVVGRTSSEAVRDEDAETAAKKLAVANVLTGSVRQSPSVVRVSAQLVDGQSGMERWSDSYDRTPGDSIKIQTDIAENVAQALSIAMTGATSAALTVGGTANAAAQNLVLQSGEAMDEGTKEGTDRAIALLDEALKLDPNYAEAYARKAIYLIRRGNAFANGGAELAYYRGRAPPLAMKALELAPKLARAHLAIAQVYQNNFNIAAASAEYERALQLAPGDAAMRRRYSYIVARVGDQGKALRLADEAIQLDPLDPGTYENRTRTLLDTRHYEDALRFAEETKRKSPELFDDPLLMGGCLAALGRYREALQQYSLEKPDIWERLTGEGLVFAKMGDRASAEHTLQRMAQLFGDNGSYQYAEIYAQLGDKDRALAALERAWAIRDGGLISIRIDALLDPLRGNPRFEAIVKRMSFPS
jgi:TolB-like protein